MDELINQVSNKIGCDPADSKKALGALLRFLQKQSNQDLFQKVTSIQGVDTLLKEPDAEVANKEDTSGSSAGTEGIFGLVLSVMKAFGILGMLKQLASTLPLIGTKAVMLIEGVEDGAELTVVLQKVGIDRTKGIQMVQMLVDFVKKKLDPEIMDKITAQIPALQAFLIESKKDE